jgi:Bacterial Ig-like domain (group 2)
LESYWHICNGCQFCLDFSVGSEGKTCQGVWGRMKKLVVVVLLMGVTLFVGCGGGSSSSGGGGNNPPTLISISVTPPSPTISLNGTQQFTATGTYSDGTTKNITSTANWLSTVTTVASISTSGLATAVGGGTTTITASLTGVSGSTMLTVANPLVSIAVTPGSASLAPNATQQYTATGTYADNSTQNLTSSVTWSASVGATITAGGLATAVTPNATVTIMATLGSISGTATMTVTNPLVSIAVTPATATIAAGFTQPYAAKGRYADNSTSVITSTVTWASSDPTVATISNTLGSLGVATGVKAGSVSITATLNSVVSPGAALTISSATLQSIAVSPANPAIVYQTQQQFTATGTFTDSSQLDITSSVAWSSSDTTKITIIPTGLATGVGTTSSPVTITATKSPASPGTTTATVVPPTVMSIAISPGTTNLAGGTSRQYLATATLSNGSTLNVTNQATWSSSAPNVASVGIHTGLVKGSSTNFGPAVISALYNGVTQTLIVSVNNVNVSSITVTPIAPVMPVGVTQHFNATAAFSDSSTQDISSDVTWASGTTSVATISNLGTATSVSPGTSTITASFGGQSGSANLTVDTSTLNNIVVSPSQTVLPVGKSINYQAYGNYSDGLQFVLTNLAQWSSSQPSVASIANTGVASTLTPGTTTITAKYQTVTSNSATVIVTQFPLASISVSPASAKVPQTVATQFTATGTFSDGSQQSLTSYATWATNPSSVATITNLPSNPGIATGVSPGQAAVTAVFAGIVNSTPSTLTVTNATIVSIALTPANASVNAGAQVSYKAVGTFSDQSQVDLTAQVTWMSSDVTVATIATTGVASTVKTGQVTITATFNGVQGTATLTVN